MPINLPRMLAVVALLVIASLANAGDRWRAQHANDETSTCDNVCQWVRNLKMPDLPLTSCCGEADRYEADDFEREGDHYIAIITDGHGVIANGTRIIVPNNKIKWDAGNPTGRGQIFLGGASLNSPGTVFCFVPPGGV